MKKVNMSPFFDAEGAPSPLRTVITMILMCLLCMMLFSGCSNDGVLNLIGGEDNDEYDYSNRTEVAPTPTPNPDSDEEEEDEEDEEEEEVAVANLHPLFVLLLVSFAMTGCTTVNNVKSGPFSLVRLESDSGTKANANASVLLGTRSVIDGQASEGSTTDGQNWLDTQGGGEVAANTAVGDSEASQEVAEAQEEASNEDVLINSEE